MQPIDKFGNPIYARVFSILKRNGLILLGSGYFESFNKPNLFYKKIPECVYFADMRSSDVIPIWEDARPLFYFQFNKDVPAWKRNRLIAEEMSDLTGRGCECRFSFYHDFDVDDSDDSGFGNGYCEICGIDFQSDGLYCSVNCRKLSEGLDRWHCSICDREIEFKGGVYHHTSYTENKTMFICKICHARIHFSNQVLYQCYRPLDKRPIKHKNKNGEIMKKSEGGEKRNV